MKRGRKPLQAGATRDALIAAEIQRIIDLNRRAGYRISVAQAASLYATLAVGKRDLREPRSRVAQLVAEANARIKAKRGYGLTAEEIQSQIDIRMRPYRQTADRAPYPVTASAARVSYYRAKRTQK